MSDQARCNGCGAAILWRYTPAGKLMPLDAEPRAEYQQGTYLVTDEKNCLPANPIFDAGREVHMNHWATCPKAKDFKP